MRKGVLAARHAFGGLLLTFVVACWKWTWRFSLAPSPFRFASVTDGDFPGGYVWISAVFRTIPAVFRTVHDGYLFNAPVFARFRGVFHSILGGSRAFSAANGSKVDGYRGKSAATSFSTHEIVT